MEKHILDLHDSYITPRDLTIRVLHEFGGPKIGGGSYKFDGDTQFEPSLQGTYRLQYNHRIPSNPKKEIQTNILILDLEFELALEEVICYKRLRPKITPIDCPVNKYQLSGPKINNELVQKIKQEIKKDSQQS